MKWLVSYTFLEGRAFTFIWQLLGLSYLYDTMLKPSSCQITCTTCTCMTLWSLLQEHSVFFLRSHSVHFFIKSFLQLYSLQFMTLSLIWKILAWFDQLERFSFSTLLVLFLLFTCSLNLEIVIVLSLALSQALQLSFVTLPFEVWNKDSNSIIEISWSLGWICCISIHCISHFVWLCFNCSFYLVVFQVFLCPPCKRTHHIKAALLSKRSLRHSRLAFSSSKIIQPIIAQEFRNTHSRATEDEALSHHEPMSPSQKKEA